MKSWSRKKGIGEQFGEIREWYKNGEQGRKEVGKMQEEEKKELGCNLAKKKDKKHVGEMWVVDYLF